MLDKYGDSNVSLSGYSMGGGKALEVMRDKDIMSRLSNDNVMIAPGITAAHPELEHLARHQKINYVYGSNDVMSNSLLAHSSDNHSVITNEIDPLKSHMLLDKLAA